MVSKNSQNTAADGKHSENDSQCGRIVNTAITAADGKHSANDSTHNRCGNHSACHKNHIAAGTLKRPMTISVYYTTPESDILYHKTARYMLPMMHHTTSDASCYKPAWHALPVTYHAIPASDATYTRGGPCS